VTGLFSPIIYVITSKPAYPYSCAISDENWAQRAEVRWKTVRSKVCWGRGSVKWDISKCGKSITPFAVQCRYLTFLLV
jgi:hypothetical protein